jgi:hypothetical protein
MIILLATIATGAKAQKVDSIYFHLYTDSLKKGFYNYINVDAKLSDGTWMPLDTSHIKLISNGGFFKGNDLYIDSSYTDPTIKVRATLKANPALWKETTIHIRKRGFDEPLRTDEEILRDLKRSSKKN